MGRRAFLLKSEQGMGLHSAIHKHDNFTVLDSRLPLVKLADSSTKVGEFKLSATEQDGHLGVVFLRVVGGKCEPEQGDCCPRHVVCHRGTRGRRLDRRVSFLGARVALNGAPILDNNLWPCALIITS